MKMVQGAVTGIDPFVSWSTFKADTIEIPRGLFLGGIFYTAEEYTPPCHISFISGPDQDCLGTWGIADASGKELGQIVFGYNTPNVGNILTTDAEYGGCLKGKIYNYNNRPTDMTESDLPQSDLEVFLRSVYGEHALDPDSLIFDICVCCSVPANSQETYNIKSITLPENMVLEQDSNGMYYVAENTMPPTSGGFIQAINCSAGTSGAILTGPIVNIIPWTMSGTSTTSSGSTLHTSYTSSIGVEDIAIVGVNGGLLVGTKNQVGQQLS